MHAVTMLVSDHRQLDHLPSMPHALVSDPTSVREPWVARHINPLGPDVVFSPMQTMGSWGRRYPLVLTVHDLIYYRHPRPPAQFAWPLRLLWRLYHLSWWPQRILLNHADAVVTVSETTRRLIEEHRLTRRPVTVVPNAADVAAPGTQADLDNSASRSLVYVGTFLPYKNVDVLAAALHELPDFTLHLISPIADADRRRLVALAPPRSTICHDGADDATYQHVLRGALALVSASRDEGFGIPLVEAMAVGVPVVASDIAIFHEVAGPVATYADPDDPAAFAGAVRALTDGERWRRQSRLGQEQSERFSWPRSAGLLLACRTETATAAQRGGAEGSGEGPEAR